MKCLEGTNCVKFRKKYDKIYNSDIGKVEDRDSQFSHYFKIMSGYCLTPNFVEIGLIVPEIKNFL